MRVVLTDQSGYVGLPLARALDRHPEITLVHPSGEHTDVIVHLLQDPPTGGQEAPALRTPTAEVVATFETARRSGAGHVIIASTIAGVTGNGHAPRPGLVPPADADGLSSGAAVEAYALAYASAAHLPTLVLRCPEPFGPVPPGAPPRGDPVAELLAAAVEGRPARIRSDPYRAHHLTYVGDLARVIADAVVSTRAAEEPLDVVFDPPRTLSEVVSVLESVLGRGLPVDWQPEVAPLPAAHRPDPARLRSLFGGIHPTPLDIALRRSLDGAAARPSSDLVGATIGAGSSAAEPSAV